jgi:hypothetical protein
VRKPWKGRLTPRHTMACPERGCVEPGQAKADRYSGSPAVAASCCTMWATTPRSTPRQRRSEREEVGRNPGPGLRGSTLGGAKPKGAASAARINRPARHQGLPQGAKPRSRGPRRRPVAYVSYVNNGNTRGRNDTWALPAGNIRIPCGRGTLRRVNPRSAVGMKQDRHGIEGSKPSRGSPNPEGGT